MTRRGLDCSKCWPGRCNPGRHYVRVPVDERTYGPYERTRAMQFGRIGSQHGSEREVWSGRPRRAGSRLVRRYERGEATYRANRAVGSRLPPDELPGASDADRGYRAFNRHAPREWVEVDDGVLPRYVRPVAGCCRIWYDSDKLMERGDRVDRVHGYVHCVLPQEDPQRSGLCVCGHDLDGHESVAEFASVHEAATARGAVAVEWPWPEAVYLIGRSLGWDEIDRGGRVTKRRFKRKARLYGSPDDLSIVAVPSRGMAMVIAGGEMHITEAGIEG